MLSEVYLLNLVAAVWLKHLRWGSPSSLLSPLLLSPFSFSVAFSHPGALLLPCIGETAWIALGQLWDGRGKLRQEKVSRQQSQGSICCEVSGNGLRASLTLCKSSGDLQAAWIWSEGCFSLLVAPWIWEQRMEMCVGCLFLTVQPHCSDVSDRVGTEGFWVKWLWLFIDRISENAQAQPSSTHMETTGVLKKGITASLKNPEFSLRHSAPFAGTEQATSIPTVKYLSSKKAANRILRSIRSKNKNVSLQTEEVIACSCMLFAHSFICHNSLVTSYFSLQHPFKFCSLSP